MAAEVRELTPDEYEEGGRVTALAYSRYARPGDSDWEEYLEEIADIADRADRTLVLAAIEDGRILGTVTLELEGRVDAGTQSVEGRPLSPGEAHVRMLGVHPDARGKGLGRLLMEACVERARNSGKTVLTLNTTDRMKEAQALYRAMGFRKGKDHVFEDGFVLRGFFLPLEPASRAG